MSKSETLRVPPVLGTGMPRPGSLLVPTPNYPTKAVLDTYSPYPIFNNAAPRDPFGLNAFLLAPFDDVWQYMNPSVMPTEALHLDDTSQVSPAPSPPTTEPVESRRLSTLRRRSPLASQPPVSAEVGTEVGTKNDGQDDIVESPLEVTPSEELGVSDVSTSEHANRRKSLPTAARLRSLISGRSSSTSMDSTGSLDVPDDTASSRISDPRTDSVCSILSSVSSSSDGSWEGIETPSDGVNVPVQVSPASVAAALDEGQKKPAWRDWINNRRSFLGLKHENGGVLESPRGGDRDLDLSTTVPEHEVIHSRIADTDAARTAAQLRRLSIAKLASLRMPSPHPFALVLARQHVNLPDEVAYSIPATKRVYPMSVNAIQRAGAELAPAQDGGLRLALAVRHIITKIDNGERPFGATPLRRNRPQHQSNIPRPRGVRDFVSRPPFEERMVTYYPGDVCTHVTMARSGFAIYDLEYSDHILAVADTEECPPTWNAAPKPQVASSVSLPPPRRRASPETNRASRLLESKRKTLFLPKEDPPPQSTSSFRTARPKPTTWDDSSDEDVLESDDEDKKKPVRYAPVANRASLKPVATTRARESRIVDPTTAMDIINRARERRAEFNAGECERKAESNNRLSMVLPSKMASQAPETRKIQHRTSTMSLAKSQQPPQRPMPSSRASSYTLNATGQRSAGGSGTKTPPYQTQPQRPPSSLPGSPRHGPQADRRRVVSQHDPMAAVAQQQRQSMMGLGMYGIHGVPAVPSVPMYPSPMMAQPMMYAPVPMTPMLGMGYGPQYGPGMPMPNMYRQPQMQIANPTMLPSPRRERPVS